MRRRWIRLLAVVAIIGAAVLMGRSIWSATATVTIPEHALREALAERFPWTVRHALVFNLAFSDARGVPGEPPSDRLRLLVDVAAAVAGDPSMGSGHAEVAVALRWDAGRASYRLDEPTVVAVVLTGAPDARRKALYDAVAETLPGRLAGIELRPHPGETRRPSDGQSVRGIAISDGWIVVTHGR